jgi:hypothetical protein
VMSAFDFLGCVQSRAAERIGPSRGGAAKKRLSAQSVRRAIDSR